MHIVANFKMNGSLRFFSTVCEKVNKLNLRDTKLILCPPFVYLPIFKLTNRKVALGSQDISNSEDGKSTGQINGKMLQEFNIKYCIVGHSERAKLGESCKVVAEKIDNAIKNNIIPIICVGENHKQNRHVEILNQIRNYFSVCSNKKVVVAYEPIWSIGTGETPSIENINEIVKLIKSEAQNFKVDVTVLYGGSVDIKNFENLKNAEIEGFLIGGLSKNFNKFLKILKGNENE